MATNPIKHPLESAKAYVALVGAIATALLAVYGSETSVGQWLTVIAIVATAVATFVIPNAGSDEPYQASDGNEFGDDVYLDGHGA